MKKIIKLPYILILALTVFIAVGVLVFSGEKTASADTDPSYRFEVSDYDVTYDISKNCSIAVTEDITIKYLGYQSTGFIRDIPINGGVQVRDVKVSKLVNGVPESVYYDVYIDYSNFLSVDIGDFTNKYNKSESYRITYTYNITNSVVNKSMLPVNPIGHGWDCAISNAKVTLVLPDGYTGAKCYTGLPGSTSQHDFDDSQKTNDGRTVITASFDRLSKYHGVTFDLNFEKGSIKNYSESSPYLFIIPAAVLIALLFILKMFVFNKNYLTPVVNYEAPNKMDPLIMGKLIDNKVNNEDITSLIFYWASKGYLKINLDDKNNPTLIRIIQTLPESCPDYERLMFYSLFQKGEIVKTSQLENRFYKTTEQVTAMVNKRSKGLYDSKSFVAAGIFTVLGGLLLGLAPVIFALLSISSKFLYLPALAVLVPVIIISLLTIVLMYNRLKYKKQTLVLCSLGIALLCVVTGLLYVFIVSSCILGTGVKIVLFIACCPLFTCSVFLVTRTKEYTEKLNDIIGFKNFIMLAEKDQLEMMLEDDPQFYYHVLPYAQVLGVTNKWEEKFANITIQPPQWLAGDALTTYVEFRIINSMIRSSMGRMSSGMVSRPSSSGSNGFGGGGGFGGGHSGGGFGGGGGRGR